MHPKFINVITIGLVMSDESLGRGHAKSDYLKYLLLAVRPVVVTIQWTLALCIATFGGSIFVAEYRRPHIRTHLFI